MQVIGAIFFFICLSFVIVILGVVVFAIYLKNKMTVFREVQAESESYHNEPYVDADFYSIGHDDPTPESFAATADEVVDGTYRVISSDDDEDSAASS
jgi:hypothetical protein